MLSFSDSDSPSSESNEFEKLVFPEFGFWFSSSMLEKWGSLGPLPLPLPPENRFLLNYWNMFDYL